MTTILNAKDIAARLDTDTRTLRKFLRADTKIDSVGKGGRYAIEAKEFRSLATRFAAWDAARRPAAAAPAEEVIDA